MQARGTLVKERHHDEPRHAGFARSAARFAARISLDDFGMGYSNLSCLSALPVELLKLDQSLIKPIASDARALRLVEWLIQLGHGLGYRMLAEGVETKEVFDLLLAAKCDAIQGYFLARPMEAKDLAAFMRAAPQAPHAA